MIRFEGCVRCWPGCAPGGGATFFVSLHRKDTAKRAVAARCWPPSCCGAVMLIVGAWLVPFLGGDALSLDVHPGWFAFMVLATSVAAVGLALLIASTSRNFEHAAALGGGLNVVLGAIAGVMVPRMLMPPSMQTLSSWSPMGWALDGMQSVFLGTPTSADILPRAGLLIAFGIGCLAWSGWRLRSSSV